MMMDHNRAKRRVKMRRKTRPMPGWMIALVDVLLIGICLSIFSLFHHVLPRSLEDNTPTDPGIEDSVDPGEELPDDSDFGYRFPNRFNLEPLISDNRYVSQNVEVTVTRVQENGITYYIQDIYIRNIDSFRTAFAKDTFGKSISEWLLDMAIRNEAVCAVNGDYYGIGSVGVVIRNGTMYRDKPDGEVLTLYRDGTMKTFASDRFDGEQAMADGAWQAWCFGPSLLGDNGEALTQFNSNIARSNPRTAVGYYEPGHYCFITVDGRQPGYSEGITFTDLSKVFADLGCKIAYNMDGGQTSVMTFLDQVVNQPYNGGRRTSDMIFIQDQ